MNQFINCKCFHMKSGNLCDPWCGAATGWTLLPKPSTLNSQSSALNSQPSTCNPKNLNQVRDEASVAFAMGQQPRLGVGSQVLIFEPPTPTRVLYLNSYTCAIPPPLNPPMRQTWVSNVMCLKQSRLGAGLQVLSNRPSHVLCWHCFS